LKIIIGLAGSLGLLAVVYTLFTQSAFSQRIGEVRKMPPLYRGLYFSLACLLVAFLVRFLRVSTLLASRTPAFLDDDLFYLFAYHLPLAVGLTLSLAVIWRYWSWLLRERI